MYNKVNFTQNEKALEIEVDNIEKTKNLIVRYNNLIFDFEVLKGKMDNVFFKGRLYKIHNKYFARRRRGNRNDTSTGVLLSGAYILISQLKRKNLRQKEYKNLNSAAGEKTYQKIKKRDEIHPSFFYSTQNIPRQN